MAGRFRLHFHCWQGEDFDVSLTYKSGGIAVDLTGCTALMHVRDAVSDALLATFTTADGTISLSAAGVIRLQKADTVTAGLPVGIKKTDLFLTWPGGKTEPLIVDSQFQVHKARTHA